MAYKHHFQEFCQHLNYHSVVFLKSSGKVLGFNNLRTDSSMMPSFCDINFNYESLPPDGSKVFYGLKLTLDRQIILCNGSINVIKLSSDALVIVFYDSRLSSFRDNQLPRILWKSPSSVYLGHSDYVPYENNLKSSMVGKSDQELFDQEFISNITHSDKAIIEQGVCFWDMMGKIKVDLFSSWVKMEKFAYYDFDNHLVGIILAYYPINQTVDSFQISGADIDSDNRVMVSKALVNANVYVVVQNLENDESIEFYTENFESLHYDFSLFLKGTVKLIDLVAPDDVERFKIEFKDNLFTKKVAYSTKIKLVDHDQSLVSCKMSFTPMVDANNKVKKIALVMEFLEDSTHDDLANFEKLNAIVNRSYTVFTVRKLESADHFEFLTENINQFGYFAKEFTEDLTPYTSLIDEAYRQSYLNIFNSLIENKLNNAIIEYPLITKRHKLYWLKESMFVINIKGSLFVESAITNITSTKLAYDTLKEINDQSIDLPADGFTPNVNYSTVVKYANLQNALSPLSEEGIDLAFFNNNDILMVPYTGHPLGYHTLMNSLTDFKSFSTTETIKSAYANLGVGTVSSEVGKSKIGTLLYFAILDDYIAKPDDNIFQDNNLFFKHLSTSRFARLKKAAEVTARNISFSLNSAAMILMQMQSAKSFQGVVHQQRLSHEILLELLNIANSATDVMDCFDQILPKVGEALNLSRASLFSQNNEGETFSCISEWYSNLDVSRKDVYTNVLKEQSFFKDWNWREKATFVINSDTVVSDPMHHRAYSKAVVGVRLTVGGKLFGSVNFADNHSVRHWTEDEIIIMEDIGYILSSVIERSSNRQELLESKQQFMATLEPLPNAVALIDRKRHRLVYANQMFRKTFFANADMQFIESEVIKKYPKINALLALDSSNPSSEIYFKDLDTWFLVNRTLVSFAWANEGELFILSDVTQNKKAHETISSLAFTDVLTGLPNRVKFERDLLEAMAKKSFGDVNSFIGIINIDNFKMINNTFSYSYGDALLKTISGLLQRIKELKGHLYRFGGDEFAFYVDHLFSDQVYEIANKIMKIFESPFSIDDYETSCTISLGIAFWKEAPDDINSLLRKANLSLIDAKTSGKNKFVVYNIGLQKYEEDTLSLQNELKKAVDAQCEEFKLHYQPIVDAKSGKVLSAEALARWYSPKYGLVSPVKFIPIAESTGLIIPLGKYLLDLACAEAKKWLDAGIDIHVSVNFSVIQLLQSDLIAIILKTLQKHKLPPKNLMVEVTESLAINDINKILEILNAIRQIGVKIAMDDFGTGYSSLNHLRRMPLNYVKFDRSFIFNIEFDPYTVSFVDAIAKFCHMKDTQVCCEGVETSTQKILLQSVGVDCLQGYLFGKPMANDDIWEYLKTHR